MDGEGCTFITLCIGNLVMCILVFTYASLPHTCPDDFVLPAEHWQPHSKFFYNESDEHKINGAKSTLLLMSLVVLVIVQTLEHFLIYINFGID